MTLRPTTIAEILDSIATVGTALGEPHAAAQLAASLRARLAVVAQKVQGLPRPRVLGLEGLVPFATGGQWLPDVRVRAGGVDALGCPPGCPPKRLMWQEVSACPTRDVPWAEVGDAARVTRRE